MAKEISLAIICYDCHNEFFLEWRDYKDSKALKSISNPSLMDLAALFNPKTRFTLAISRQLQPNHTNGSRDCFVKSWHIRPSARCHPATPRRRPPGEWETYYCALMCTSNIIANVTLGSNSHILCRRLGPKNLIDSR